MLTNGIVWPIVGIALVFVASRSVRRGLGFWETLARLVFVGYVGVVLAVTLFPLPLDPGYLQRLAAQDLKQNSLVPLASIIGSWSDGWYVFTVQVGGNMALFFPLGFLLPSIWSSSREMKSALMAIVLSSLAIECLQFAISTMIGVTYRSFDVDDLLLNTLGGLLGYLCFRVAHEKLKARRRQRTPKEAVAAGD